MNNKNDLPTPENANTKQVSDAGLVKLKEKLIEVSSIKNNKKFNVSETGLVMTNKMAEMWADIYKLSEMEAEMEGKALATTIAKNSMTEMSSEEKQQLHGSGDLTISPSPQLTANQKQASAETTITNAEGIETKSTEAVGKPKLFASPPCEVGTSAGLTINLGNYSSARFEVSLKIPCAHTELSEVYDFAQKWVDDRMTKLAKKITPDAK